MVLRFEWFEKVVYIDTELSLWVGIVLTTLIMADLWIDCCSFSSKILEGIIVEPNVSLLWLPKDVTNSFDDVSLTPTDIWLLSIALLLVVAILLLPNIFVSISQEGNCKSLLIAVS